MKYVTCNYNTSSKGSATLDGEEVAIECMHDLMTIVFSKRLVCENCVDADINTITL